MIDSPVNPAGERTGIAVMKVQLQFWRSFPRGKQFDASGRRIYYRGSSMGDTFRPGDLLYVVPYGQKKVRRGDVIVFVAPHGEKKIVHRVVSAEPRGIRTKGDNSWKEDRYLLQPDHIVGRVTYAKGGKRWRRVPGGAAGKWCAWKMRMGRRMRSGVSSWIVPRLGRIIGVKAFRRAMEGRIPTRIVAIERAGGTELQLLSGRAFMGRIVPGQKSWDLRWPMRLLISEESLPSGKSITQIPSAVGGPSPG